MEFLNIIAPIASIVAAVAAIILLIMKSKGGNGEIDTNGIEKEMRNGFSSSQDQIQRMIEINNQASDQITKLQTERLNSIRDSIEGLDRKLNEKVDRLTESQQLSMKTMMENNQKKLDEIKGTVDHKLSETIEKKFNESFDMINKQLDSVNRSLVDMRVLVDDVGSLKEVLGGSKTKGNYGEMQLEELLNNVLSPDQIKKDVHTTKGGDSVEFCVVLTNEEGETLLPIDSKFLSTPYLRVVEANKSFEKKEIQSAEKAFVSAIKEQAKKITKYINTPLTTDYAIMFLPTEAMYAEVARQSDLQEGIFRDYRVIITGPNNLHALLCSLSLAMKQIAINKRSTEIVKLLNAFKKEFRTFVDCVEETQKKIDGAATEINKAKKKTDKINKQLDSLGDISTGAKVLIEDQEEDDDDE